MRASTRWLAAALLLAWTAQAAGQERAPQAIEARPVAEGVTALLMSPDGTVLVASGADGVLVVDAGAAGMAARVDSAVASVARGRVRWVVSTHFHADHLGANPRFRSAGAELIAHANLAAEAARDTTIAELGWERMAAPPGALPTRTFRDSLLIELGGETAVVLHAPRAHTSGDAVVHLLRANVLHTGDIVEFGAYPFIDRWAGGSIDGVVAAVETILARTDGRTRLVPGHGGIFGRPDVEAYLAMLLDLRAQVVAAVRAGRSADDLVAGAITAPYDGRHGGARQGARFVRLLHAEVIANGK